MTYLRHTTLTLVFLATPAFAACDLPQKNIGDESDSNASDGDDPDSDGDSMGGQCEPGQQTPAPDGCNTCFCTDDGGWACTEIGCVPPDPTAGDECMDGDEMPAPDDCNTCFCMDGLWACTQLGCPPPDTDGEPPVDPQTTDPFSNNGVHICEEGVPRDALVIDDVALEGHQLTVDLAYSGGCAEHLIGTCWDGQFLESFPVQVSLGLAHDGMQDPCEAFPSEQRVFDLSSLAEAYNDAYQTNGGTIIISLEGYGEPIEYSF